MAGLAGAADIAGRNRMGYIATGPEHMEVSMRIRSRLALTIALVAGFAAQALAAEYMEKNERQRVRAYSPGVVTEGGRIVWLAGQTALQDDHGKDLAGNFEGQARQIFHLIDQTLNKAGGGLATMERFGNIGRGECLDESGWFIRRNRRS
jgi:hypothetical protein